MEIQKVLLEDINLQDSFFNSLRTDYPGFNQWFKRKQNKTNYAYVTYMKEKALGSFLLLKLENSDEYLRLTGDKSAKEKVLKISSFKVLNTGLGIASSYLKIIDEVAFRSDVNLIYITVYPKYKDFIDFLTRHNFMKVGMKKKEIVLKKTLF